MPGVDLGVLGSALPLTATTLERGLEALAKRLSPLPGGSTAGATSSSRPATAAEAVDLLDMAVPPDVLEVVAPALGEFDIRIEPTIKSNAIFRNAKMHVAVDGTFSTYLLHFRKDVLENSRWAREVIGYSSLFKPGDNVHVLSKECGDPEPAYEWAWEMWTEAGVTTRYVEWRHLARMYKLQQTERAEILEIAFKLPKTLKRRGERQPQDLLDDARRVTDLVALLSGLGVASGNADASAFFNNLLIGPVPQEMRRERTLWGQGYDTAARECLQWLHTKGRGPDGSTYLGAVLVSVMDQISADGHTVIIETIEGFKLIADPDVVSKLRQKYLSSGRP